MTNSIGITAIKNESERLSWPATFQSDLERDCAVLANPNAPTCFGWAVRYSGTILALPGEIQDLRICEWFHAQSGMPHYYYWFDGVELGPVNFAAFIAQIEAALDPVTYVGEPEYDEVLHRWQRHHAGSEDHHA